MDEVDRRACNLKQRVCFVVIVKLMRIGKKWVGMMGIVQEAIK